MSANHIHSLMPETCERKKLYRHRKDATRDMQATIRRLRKDQRKGFAVYQCIFGEHFHFGHKPKSWYNHKHNTKEL